MKVKLKQQQILISHYQVKVNGKLGIEADGFKNYEKQTNFSLLDNAIKERTVKKAR